MQKVLITGANGLIGRKVARAFASSGVWDVLATSRSRPEPADSMKVEALDITNQTEVIYTFESFCPDVVINCAGMTSVDQCEEDRPGAWSVNVTGPGILARCSTYFNSYFIHFSTDFVFDGLKGMYSEDDEPEPVSYYGITKLESEKLVKELAPQSAIVRTVLVYGYEKSMVRQNFLLWIYNSALNATPIQVVDDQFRTPTLAEDIAIACVKLAEKRSSGIFHISGKDYLSVYDFALRITAHMGLSDDFVEPVPSSSLNQKGRRPMRTGFSLSKALTALDYYPVSIDEGILSVLAQIKL